MTNRKTDRETDMMSPTQHSPPSILQHNDFYLKPSREKFQMQVRVDINLSPGERERERERRRE